MSLIPLGTLHLKHCPTLPKLGPFIMFCLVFAIDQCSSQDKKRTDLKDSYDIEFLFSFSSNIFHYLCTKLNLVNIKEVGRKRKKEKERNKEPEYVNFHYSQALSSEVSTSGESGMYTHTLINCALINRVI